MKKKRYIIVVLILLIVGVVSFSSADEIKQLKERLHISTDTVNIEIINNTDYSMPLVPNKKIPFDIKVQNKGTNCYVRFKTVLIVNDNRLVVLNNKSMNVDKMWNYNARGYYYSDLTLLENNEFKLFDEVTLPSDLNISSNDKVEVITTVDAIQSANFKQDFSSDDVWGNQEIKKTVKTRVEGN